MAHEKKAGITKVQVLALWDKRIVTLQPQPPDQTDASLLPFHSVPLQPASDILKTWACPIPAETLQYLSSAFRITKTQSVNMVQKVLPYLALTSSLSSLITLLSSHTGLSSVPGRQLLSQVSSSCCYTSLPILVPHHGNTCTQLPQFLYPSGHTFLIHKISHGLLDVLTAPRTFPHTLTTILIILVRLFD